MTSAKSGSLGRDIINELRFEFLVETGSTFCLCPMRTALLKPKNL